MKIWILVLAVFLTQSAFAVPIPRRNCGHPGDLLSVQALEASIWPLRLGGAAFPVWTVAKLSPNTGKLKELRAGFIGPNWVFELDHPDHGIEAEDGFVALPDSWLIAGSPPMHVTTTEFEGLPPGVQWRTSYPMPAGPITLGPSFTLPPMSPLGRPASFLFKANLAAPVTPTAVLSFGFEGRSGFPISPTEPGVSTLRIQVTSGANGVICMDLTEPNSPLVSIEPVPLRDFDWRDGKGRVELSWNYDDDAPSAAMRPEVLYRPCGASTDADVEAEGEQEYDSGSHIWSFAWDISDLDESCYEMTVVSNLTGQRDGPYRVERSE